MHWLTGILVFLGLVAAPPPPRAVPPPQSFVVRPTTILDQKAVFATIESANVVPARARIGGTIIELKVRQGDRVEQGEVIATVGDQKLALQINSFAAQVGAAQAQLVQAKLQLDRARKLVAEGAIATSAFDQAKTGYSVALSNLNSISAQRSVVQQQVTEGQILAPTAGRVITVPVTAGTVVMGGDTVATVAEQNFVLRLEVPERHARYMKAGDPVRLDGGELGLSGSRFGTIKLVYPQIDNGHVVADAQLSGLSDYFVGQRVRVWVSAGPRQAIVVPAHLLRTRFGIDYARLWQAGAPPLDVPVQRGEDDPTPNMKDGVEILSGLQPGDRLLQP